MVPKADGSCPACQKDTQATAEVESSRTSIGVGQRDVLRNPRPLKFTLRGLFVLMAVIAVELGILMSITEERSAYIGWLFDWGLFKRWGGLILFLSSGFYLACLGGAIVLLRQVGRMLGSGSLAIFLGTFLIGPMVYMAWQSVDLQQSTAHYQESTHIPAVLTVLVSFTLTLVLWFTVKCWRPYRARRIGASRVHPTPTRSGSSPG